MNDDHWIIVLYHRYRELFGDPDAATHPGDGTTGDARDPLAPSPVSRC